jgi:hypothetical protein
METYWDDSGNNLHYLYPVDPADLHPNAFFGAFGSNSRCVYTVNGNEIAFLPDDLILDEALAAARMLILAHRR